MNDIEKLLQNTKTPSPNVSRFQRELRQRVTRPRTVSYRKPFYTLAVITASMTIVFVALFQLHKSEIESINNRMTSDHMTSDQNDKTPALIKNELSSNVTDAHTDSIASTALDVTPVSLSSMKVEHYEYIIYDTPDYSY